MKELKEQVQNRLENICEMDKETVDFLVYVDQIEIGRVEEATFVATETALGTPMIRKGRIPFAKVREIGVVTCEFLKTSTNPKTDIKHVLNMRKESGVKKANDKVEKSTKMKTRDKQVVCERNESIHKELPALEEAGLKVNNNCLWAIYKIVRGEKRTERFKEDGYDIEVLLAENACITPEQMEEIYERRSEIYENEE